MAKEPQLRFVYVLRKGEGPEPKQFGHPYGGMTFPNPWNPELKKPLEPEQILERPDTPANRQRFLDLVSNMHQVHFADLETQLACQGKETASKPFTAPWLQIDEESAKKPAEKAHEPKASRAPKTSKHKDPKPAEKPAESAEPKSAETPNDTKEG